MATIDIPDKICPHCGGIRWTSEYKTLASGEKVLRYRCSVSAIERSNKWKARNPEATREHNITSCRKRRANGYYKTPKEQERSRLRAKKERDALNNNYVHRRILSDPEMKGIDRSAIPQWLIETKRKQLSLIREIKNNGKSN